MRDHIWSTWWDFLISRLNLATHLIGPQRFRNRFTPVDVRRASLATSLWVLAPLVTRHCFSTHSEAFHESFRHITRLPRHTQPIPNAGPHRDCHFRRPAEETDTRASPVGYHPKEAARLRPPTTGSAPLTEDDNRPTRRENKATTGRHRDPRQPNPVTTPRSPTTSSRGDIRSQTPPHTAHARHYARAELAQRTRTPRLAPHTERRLVYGNTRRKHRSLRQDRNPWRTPQTQTRAPLATHTARPAGDPPAVTHHGSAMPNESATHTPTATCHPPTTKPSAGQLSQPKAPRSVAPIPPKHTTASSAHCETSNSPPRLASHKNTPRAESYSRHETAAAVRNSRPCAKQRASTTPKTETPTHRTVVGPDSTEHATLAHRTTHPRCSRRKGDRSTRTESESPNRPHGSHNV